MSRLEGSSGPWKRIIESRAGYPSRDTAPMPLNSTARAGRRLSARGPRRRADGRNTWRHLVDHHSAGPNGCPGADPRIRYDDRPGTDRGVFADVDAAGDRTAREEAHSVGDPGVVLDDRASVHQHALADASPHGDAGKGQHLRAEAHDGVTGEACRRGQNYPQLESRGPDLRDQRPPPATIAKPEHDPVDSLSSQARKNFATAEQREAGRAPRVSFHDVVQAA